MIGFIENQHLNLSEVDGFVIQVVKQASGAGNDDFCTLSYFFYLARLADSTIHNNAAQAGLSGHGADILMDLFSKFAGRGNDKRPYFFAGSGLEALQEWKNKGCGLSGASLGKTKNITASKDGGHGLMLNRGWGSVTAGFNACHYLGVKLKIFKTH
jgi:hypothetical protein